MDGGGVGDGNWVPTRLFWIIFSLNKIGVDGPELICLLYIDDLMDLFE